MIQHRVSVIIPSRDRAHLIRRAVRSVLDQTVEVYEVIVVDDGSVDDTRDVVAEIAALDQRVVYVHQDNAGAPAARNNGIRRSSGTLIAFQDSDDEWSPTFLESLVPYHHAAGIVSFCSLASTRDGATFDVTYPEMIEDVVSVLTRTNCISTQTALADAGLLRRHNFDEDLPRLQDWDLWLSLVGTAEFRHHPEALALQYLQSDSITAGSVTLYAALRIITRKHWRVLGRHPLNFLRLWLSSRIKVNARATS